MLCWLAPKNSDGVHLKDSKKKWPYGFSDVVLKQAHGGVRKLYDACKKA